MSNNPFEKLLDQFNEQVLRPILTNGKEKLDQAIESVPSSLLAAQLEEAFEQLKNPGANALGGQLDASKIEPLVDALKTQLQNPTVSLVVAHGLKELAKRKGADLGDFAALIDLENTSAEDIAAQLRTLAATLPSGLLAAQIGELLKQAPQLPQQKTPDLGQLPAPDALAEATLDALKEASKTLGNAAKGATLNDTVNALKLLPANLNDIFSRLAAKQGNQNQPQAPAKKPVVKRKPGTAPRRRKGNGHGGQIG